MPDIKCQILTALPGMACHHPSAQTLMYSIRRKSCIPLQAPAARPSEHIWGIRRRRCRQTAVHLTPWGDWCA